MEGVVKHGVNGLGLGYGRRRLLVWVVVMVEGEQAETIGKQQAFKVKRQSSALMGAVEQEV